MTTLFADFVYRVRRGSLTAIYPSNHFATVTERLMGGVKVEVCVDNGLPEYCRGGFHTNFDFSAIREQECSGSDIPIETVIAELAGSA